MYRFIHRSLQAQFIHFCEAASRHTQTDWTESNPNRIPATWSYWPCECTCWCRCWFVLSGHFVVAALSTPSPAFTLTPLQLLFQRLHLLTAPGNFLQETVLHQPGDLKYSSLEDRLHDPWELGLKRQDDFGHLRGGRVAGAEVDEEDSAVFLLCVCLPFYLAGVWEHRFERRDKCEMIGFFHPSSLVHMSPRSVSPNFLHVIEQQLLVAYGASLANLNIG